MFNVGGGEILVILLVALIVLGPTKLPGAARQIGSFLTEVRRMSNDFKRELKDAMPEEVADLKRDLDDARRSLASMTVDERIEAQARERGRAIVADEDTDESDEPAVSTAEAAGMFTGVTTLGPTAHPPADAEAGASADADDGDPGADADAADDDGHTDDEAGDDGDQA